MPKKKDDNGMIRVRVLGEVDLQIGHRRVGMNTETLFALAFFLVMRAGEPIPRDELLTTLWDQGEDEQRRHALRQLLYRLRQKGLDLAEDGERVLLSSERVDCDFLSALDPKWPDQATAAEIDAAAAFGPSFSKRMASGYLQWLDGRLNALAEQHRKASLGQIALARREGRWADLERWAQSVLRTDPLNEEATLARAESAAMGGSKVMAMEILDNYLAEVWEISPELGKPAQALRKRLAERRPDWSYRGPREVPLVGRTELMSRLTTLVDAAWKGDGGAVVLVGAPGIGKTRLAMETRAYAELKGMRTVVVRAEAGMVERPLSIVQQVATHLIALPGAAGAHPASLEFARASIDQRSAPWDRVLAEASDHSQKMLTQSLQDIGEAVSHESRLLVVVDDLHNCDLVSLQVLGRLARSLSGGRSAWIFTTRPKSHSSHSSSGAESVATSIRVSGLSDEGARALVAATLEANRASLGPDVLSEVVRNSAGNPLFLRELGIARANPSFARKIPDTLSHLIQSRLENVPTEYVRLLRVVALAGGATNLSVLGKLVEMHGSTLTDAIEALERDGIVGLGPLGTLRLHECWREAVLERLSPATRIAMSRECADVLSSSDHSSLSGIALWRAADLYLGAQEPRKALELYDEAAERLFVLGFPTEAIDVLERTERLAAGHRRRSWFASRLARAHLAAGNTERALTLAQVVCDTGRPDDPDAIRDSVLAECVRAEASLKLARDADNTIKSILELATDESLAVEQRRLLCLYGIRLAASASSDADMSAFFREARRITPAEFVDITDWLTSVVYYTELGSVDDILRAHRALPSASLAVQTPLDRCRLLRFRCHSLRVAGALSEAATAGRQAFELAADSGLHHDARLAAELLAFFFLDQRDLENAEDWIGRASALVPDSEYSAWSPSLRHAIDRLSLQHGEFEDLASRLAPRLHDIRSGGSVRNRLGELSTFALALAELARTDEARAILDEIIPELNRVRGSFSGDYPTEVAARALTRLGQADRANSIARAHMSEKNAKRARPLPEFYELLATCRD